MEPVDFFTRLEQDNNRRNGEFLKKYAEGDKDKIKPNYWGKWKVDNSSYPKSKVTETEAEIDAALTDFLHYIISNSNYQIDYLLSISVVEFYAILKRIDAEVSKKTEQIKKIK